MKPTLFIDHGYYHRQRLIRLSHIDWVEVAKTRDIVNIGLLLFLITAVLVMVAA